VTEERLALEASQAARMNDAKGIGFYQYDVASELAWWSAEMFRLLDYPYCERVDLEAATKARVHPEDRDRLLALQKTVARRPGPYEIEYRVLQEGGGVRWMRDRGEALGPLNPATGQVWQVRGTLTDVTGQDEAAPRTPASVEVDGQIIERAPWGICVIDADFRLVRASAIALRQLPGSEAALGRDFGETLRMMLPGPSAAVGISQFRHTLETGEPYHSSAGREMRVDRGRTEVYEWRLEQVRMADGRPGVVCYFYDLTDRMRQEEELRDSQERLQLAYEASEMGAWDLDLTTGRAVWTSKLYELLGLDRTRPASAELFFEHVHPEDQELLRAAFNRSIETGEIFEAGFRIRRNDGVLRHMAGRGRIVRREAGVPVRMIGVNFDVTERRRLERQLRDHDRELRLILDNSVAFIGLLEPDGTLLEVNATALIAGGLARGDVIGIPFWQTPWWSHDEDVVMTLRDAIEHARAGEAAHYDTVVRMKEDRRMKIDFLLAPIFDDEGNVRRLVASAFDITDREQALERVELLMREINHRSKNTLALVQAVARQIWCASPEDFFDRFAARLQALAASQDILIDNDTDAVFIEDLARAQLAHFEEFMDHRIRLTGPQIRLKAEAAQSMGMALHELATNAGKYGALSGDAGEVLISWEGEDGQFVISWVERRGPAVEPPADKGFGSFVLDSIVRGTLGGHVAVEYAPEGFRWRLTCSEDCAVSTAPDS
jgi:PAS domain S-box-containing protein